MEWARSARWPVYPEFRAKLDRFHEGKRTDTNLHVNETTSEDEAVK